MEKERLRSRAKKKRLRVTFPNGKVICYNNTTTTMIAVLIEIGSDRFSSINMNLCHLPLLSRTIYPKYTKWMKPICDGWYLNTQSDSESKFMQLHSINEQLATGLIIEIGSDFDVYEPPAMEKKSRTKDKLQVTFPNGEYIADYNALNTYLCVIKKIGIDEIMKKHITWRNIDLITFIKKTNYQVQIDENRWVIVPNTTKDKAKVLRTISVMFQIKLDITCFSTPKNNSITKKI